MFDLFTDPPVLPELQGLQHGECQQCGGPALVDAKYVGPVHCSACWSRLHGVANLPMPRRGASIPVVRPRIVRGEMDAPRAQLGDTPDLSEPGRYRIITPACEAKPEETPDAVAKFAANLADVQVFAVTYAAAEDLKLERLVRSVAVRVRDVGYAIWQQVGDGRWTTHAAQIADPYLRTCSVTEFVTLALGRPWTPPKPLPAAVRGPCWRCQLEVRWKNDPFEPYKHNRPGTEKVPCLAGSQATK